MDGVLAATQMRQMSSRRTAKDATAPGKPTKACVPCRNRKTKCDAATTGLPCSGCVSRQCPDRCVVSARKPRKRAAPKPQAKTAGSDHHSSTIEHISPQECPGDRNGHSREASSHNSRSFHPGRESQSDLHYLHILKDAVNSNVPGRDESDSPFTPREEDPLTPQIRVWNKPAQLDDVDKKFLGSKKVFDLPPKQHLDVLLKTYFDHVYAFVPVLDRIDFVRKYESGSYSLFLLYAMLATASLYAPHDVLTACGFSDRSAAQATFTQRATLLYDFQFEEDVLSLFQGSVMLGTVIPDSPTDKDFHYWFFNSIRLAAKLGICNGSHLDDKVKYPGLYKRIYWVLYCHNVFLLILRPRNVQLMGYFTNVEHLTKHDWGSDAIPTEFQSVLQPITDQQKASFGAQCELSEIFSQLMSSVNNNQPDNARKLLEQVDVWRMSLIDKLRIRQVSPDGDVHYAGLKVASYRFESAICRMIRRQAHSPGTSRVDWATQRLRSAIFELDAIAGRMLANDMIQKLPISLITAIPALLALHIESALDENETDIIRSMSRISISQTMLVLGQLKEIPAIKRAIPVFELVLSNKGLPGAPAMPLSNTAPHNVSDEQNVNGSNLANRLQPDMYQLQDAPGELYDAFLGDFLDFNVMDKWDFGQNDFTRIY